MRTIVIFAAALAASVTAPVLAADDAPPAAESTQVQVKKGDHIFDVNGKHIGRVYQLNASGNPEIIRDIRLITVPLATLSLKDGKLVTSLTLGELTK